MHRKLKGLEYLKIQKFRVMARTKEERMAYQAYQAKYRKENAEKLKKRTKIRILG